MSETHSSSAATPGSANTETGLAPDRAARRAWTVYWWISTALQGIMAIGLAGAVYEQQWMTAFTIAAIILLTLVPHALSQRYRIHIPPEFEALAIVFVFASLFLGDIRGYYDHYWWWDAALHTGSGLLLGLLGFLLVYVVNRHERLDVHMKPGFVALFAFSFAVCLGALWEIFEYALDATLGTTMQASLVDTNWDLIVDSLGALIISVLGYGYVKGNAERFLFNGIRRFIEANPRLFERRADRS